VVAGSIPAAPTDRLVEIQRWRGCSGGPRVNR
jgi:hypothetical protein